MLDAVRAGATLQTARDGALARLVDRDRRLAYELAAGVLRRRVQLDTMLELATADPRLHDVLRLGAYQLRALARVPPYAAVSTSVELAREVAGDGAARYVNQALRKLTVVRGQVPGVRASHPAWLARPPVTLQAVRWDHDLLGRRLREAGVGVTDAPFGAGLRLTLTPGTRRLTLRELPGFAEGAFIVQDPAHALVCRYAAIPPGTVVYDACAAPGGKAVTLEHAAVRVVAGEVRRERVPRLVETARRAGVAIRVAVADLLAAPFRSGEYAAVLVDAPCTATGTMARHPDARWRLTPRSLTRAVERQRALLAAAAELVRPGGLLIYATCSLEREENGDVVTEFLARHPDFSRAPVAGAVPDALLTTDGDFQSLPQRHAMDGAYAARLARTR